MKVSFAKALYGFSIGFHRNRYTFAGAILLNHNEIDNYAFNTKINSYFFNFELNRHHIYNLYTTEFNLKKSHFSSIFKLIFKETLLKPLKGFLFLTIQLMFIKGRSIGVDNDVKYKKKNQGMKEGVKISFFVIIL